LVEQRSLGLYGHTLGIKIVCAQILGWESWPEIVVLQGVSLVWTSPKWAVGSWVQRTTCNQLWPAAMSASLAVSAACSSKVSGSSSSGRELSQSPKLRPRVGRASKILATYSGRVVTRWLGGEHTSWIMRSSPLCDRAEHPQSTHSNENVVHKVYCRGGGETTLWPAQDPSRGSRWGLASNACAIVWPQWGMRSHDRFDRVSEGPVDRSVAKPFLYFRPRLAVRVGATEPSSCKRCQVGSRIERRHRGQD
jgi:hypothetical protein